MWLLTAGLCRWRFLAAAPLAPLPRRAPRPATLALPALSRLLPRARAARPAALVRSPSAPTALAPPAAPLAPLVPTSPLMPATTSAARELPCPALCCTGSACIMVLVRCFTSPGGHRCEQSGCQWSSMHARRLHNHQCCVRTRHADTACPAWNAVAPLATRPRLLALARRLARRAGLASMPPLPRLPSARRAPLPPLPLPLVSGREQPHVRQWIQHACSLGTPAHCGACRGARSHVGADQNQVGLRHLAVWAQLLNPRFCSLFDRLQDLQALRRRLRDGHHRHRQRRHRHHRHWRHPVRRLPAPPAGARGFHWVAVAAVQGVGPPG